MAPYGTPAISSTRSPPYADIEGFDELLKDEKALDELLSKNTKEIDELFQNHMCRVACLSDVIGLLKEKFGVASFPGLDVTEDMAKLSKVRVEKSREKFPHQWKDEEKEIDFEASLKKAFETFKQKLGSL